MGPYRIGGNSVWMRRWLNTRVPRALEMLIKSVDEAPNRYQSNCKSRGIRVIPETVCMKLKVGTSRQRVFYTGYGDLSFLRLMVIVFIQVSGALVPFGYLCTHTNGWHGQQTISTIRMLVISAIRMSSKVAKWLKRPGLNSSWSIQKKLVRFHMFIDLELHWGHAMHT